MKRCPECRRDYYDDSLLYCLEDGNALVQGSVPLPDEPATAILSGLGVPPSGGTESEAPASAGGQFAEAKTRVQIHATAAAEAEPPAPLRDSTERQSHSAMSGEAAHCGRRRCVSSTRSLLHLSIFLVYETDRIHRSDAICE